MLTVVIMVIFCVTAVQAETKEGTTGTAKQWWQDGYVPPPKAEAPAATEEVTAPKVEEPATAAEVAVPKAELPAASVEVAAPKAERPAQEKVSIPLNVQFDTAKSVVKKKYDNDIKKVADFMKAHPWATAVVEGHTDNVDKFNNPDNNMKLSQARADSVRQYLIDNFGIDASRITAVGYGPNKPIASNDTKEGRKKNRRIQAVIEMVKTK
jgi:OOP family OmpA-OmpF porin